LSGAVDAVTTVKDIAALAISAADEPAGLQPGYHAADGSGADVGLAGDRGCGRPASSPVSREHASASSTKRSFPEVGEHAHAQFITAMLTVATSSGVWPREPGS
jgi:hypothetical protein